MSKKLPNNFTVIVSRTDSIGDVMLTLPMTGQLKRTYPKCKIIFLGRTYTRDIINVCRHVDEFRNYDELVAMPRMKRKKELQGWRADAILHVFPRADIARMAYMTRIVHRAGTRSRWYHWIFCNHLLKLPRKRSRLHESQLNMKILSVLKVQTILPLEEIGRLYGFNRLRQPDDVVNGLIDRARRNVILHPRSKGSAVEWGLHNYAELITLLPPSRYKLFVTGTDADGASMKGFLTSNPEVTNLCGALTLNQLIAFINMADALVAASTGPLHIAAALGVKSIGLYSSRRPLFPQRWAPVGRNAYALVAEPPCEKCRAGKNCDCVQQISPRRVYELLEK